MNKLLDSTEQMEYPKCSLFLGEKPHPCLIVIFGGAGDLTKRLLMPAIYNLKAGELLPDDFAILAVAHTDKNTDSYRQELSDQIKQFATGDVDLKLWDDLAQHIFYLRGGFDDPNTYSELKKQIESLSNKFNLKNNVLFYYATAADFFTVMTEQLSKAGLLEQQGYWRRVIVEKPFGVDYESARNLNTSLLTYLKEEQIYRIDHYLGKETVQNIMVLRFANGLYEPIWNRNSIDHVQITVAESVGVENRGNYYDKFGALKDMVPNHIFNLLSLICMESPTSLDPDALRTEKLKVLQSLRPYTAKDVDKYVVRAQYTKGKVNDTDVVGYVDSPRVDPNSRTETYVAMELHVDNWRWSGVPFFLRTGKCLSRKHSEIAIAFKRAPVTLFRESEHCTPRANYLILNIQPEEGISMEFGAKVPGPSLRLGDVQMEFNYRDYFGKTRANGYETLVYDSLIGDNTLFQRADAAEMGWKIVEPILNAWHSSNAKPAQYAAGSEGPDEADKLIGREGRQWRSIRYASSFVMHS